jgi:putative transposase
LVGSVEERLKEIVKEVCAEVRDELIELECDKDHIHILVDIDPQYGIHSLIKLIKGRSSFLLRKEFPFLKRTMRCMWTNSYFVSTVGGATLKVVKQYIENQKLRSS